MLAIEVELLSGRYAAAAFNDRDRVEWPPHPARLFSALVATWAEHEPSAPGGVEELEVLNRLSELPPPELLVSDGHLAGQRTVTRVFVPVNDESTVSPPNRSALDAAEAEALRATDEKSASRAAQKARSLRKRYQEACLKALAAPTSVGKGDVPLAPRVVFPERRKRQPRTFPVATPEVPRFAFVWRDVEQTRLSIPTLDRLLARLVRLGHSSSHVRARSCDAADLDDLQRRTIRLVPDEESGTIVLRWVAPGQVARLVEAHQRHREVEPRVLPARFVRYARFGTRQAASAIAGFFDPDLVVFSRIGGVRLPITAVAAVARQFRRAMMSSADEPIDPIISGHAADGSPFTAGHLAVVPLSFVGHRHADGTVMGVALVFPQAVSQESRRVVLRAIGRLERAAAASNDPLTSTVRLAMGDAGVLELERVAWGESDRMTLRPATWCGPSTRWVTATPIALDRNPGNLHDADEHRRRAAFEAAEASVRESLRLVLAPDAPDPDEVQVLRSAALTGTTKPQRYPHYPMEPGRTQRVLVHARVRFSTPVRGPLLVGAGRYQGLGLMLPVDGGPMSSPEGEP